MPVYEIRNNALTVKVNSFGAELCSVVDNTTAIEYIWQANKEVWPRYAPNLFPIVGKLKNGAYTYREKRYELPQHGFARDNEFICVEQLNDKLVFELSSTKDTLLNFPFTFRLQIAYTLDENSVQVNY